jgi:hypothetical protein
MALPQRHTVQEAMKKQMPPIKTDVFIYSINKQGVKWQKEKHTTPRIRWSSPTQLLIQHLSVYRTESGRDPELSDSYGRMC